MHSSIKEFAERKAMALRQEALAWDIVARDMRRLLQGFREEAKKPKAAQPKSEPPVIKTEDRLYVRPKEARRIMGLGNSSLYKEISEGRLPVRKSGHVTLIAVKDINAWFEALPEK